MGGISLNSFKKIGLATQKECLGFRIETKNVERIADSVVAIAERLQSSGSQKTKFLALPNVSELALASANIFEDVMKAHFKRDFDLAENIISEARELGERVSKARFFALTSELNPVEQALFMEISENIKQIANYCKEIAEILLNRTIDDDSAR